MIYNRKAIVIGAWALLASTSAGATPFVLDGTINIFRDTRGLNDVGIAQGDNIQFGASVTSAVDGAGNVVLGSGAASIAGRFVPTGSLTPTVNQAFIPCGPLSVNPNFCARTATFSADRVDGTWSIRFADAIGNRTVTAPSLAGAENPFPFPGSVTISGTGATPTIGFSLPSGVVPDAIRVNIFDRSPSAKLANGQQDIIHSVDLPGNISSYTIPQILSSSKTLAQGGNYSINFQLIETRGHQAFTGNNAQILRRSSSFFAFTPLGSGAPNEVHLPMVGIDPNPNDDRGAPYVFSVDHVDATSVTFIDPTVAVGYDYAIGAGDPNFSSLVLPDVGDGKYILTYLDHGTPTTVSLDEAVEFFFPEGGVAQFSVGGIETSAGLDPTDPNAFVTGLRFVRAGSFTGTMTPILATVPDAIPEPSTLALFGSSFLALVGAFRRRFGGVRT